MLTEREVLIWLNSIPGIAGVRTRALLEHFADIRAIARADRRALAEVEGIGPVLAKSIAESDAEAFLAQETADAEKHGIRILTVRDDDYPGALKAIHDPPCVLYIKGSFAASDVMAIGVVGSRRCSMYGRTHAAKISRELVRRGLTVVSGCALGIDRAAHEGALKAGGRTIGVVGSGLLKPYPLDNRDIMDAIAVSGVLISEFHLRQGVERGNFVRRNRVISGLSLGVLVVEATRKSGALITARYALEQGRDVFALPGSVDSPRSWGPHGLIRDGARLVENAADIIDELGDLGTMLTEAAAPGAEIGPAAVLAGGEEKVFALLDHEPAHIDTLIVRSGMSPGTVAGALVMLEMKNMIQSLPGKRYARV